MIAAFLFDTNVLTELMRTQPESAVITWFDRHVDALCYTSSITKAEIFLGIALLPKSTRRTRLENAAQTVPEEPHSCCIYFGMVVRITVIRKTAIFTTLLF